MSYDDPSSLGAKLQEVWREIVQAEHARGSANAGAQAATAEAQVAYEEALRRFRHMQLEAFTVTLGEAALVREQIAALEAQVAALARRVAALEAPGSDDVIGGPV